MNRFTKWGAIGLGGLFSLLLIAVLILYMLSAARINKRYELTNSTVAIPTDAAALAR
jgi:hypothetical protein